MLTDGQTVRVVLEESKPRSVVVVPQQAIAIDQTGPYLFVVDDKNVVELRRVKTGNVRNGLLVDQRGAEAGREGHRPGPAARPPRHDRGAEHGRDPPGQAEAIAP